MSTPTPPMPMHACKEWWEVSVPVSFGDMDRRAFRFDLPEHLPSSPMCPANKRHKSGGTGVCVYHGRAKGRGGGENMDMDTDEAGSDVWK